MSETREQAVEGLFNLIAGIDGGENNSQRQEAAYKFLRTINNSAHIADEREAVLREKIAELEKKLKTQHPSAGVHAIADERRRQMEKLGWTPEADEEWTRDQLTNGAIAYLLAAPAGGVGKYGDPAKYWPWCDSIFRPETPMRCLEKAGAMVAAEIDRRKREEANNA